GQPKAQAGIGSREGRGTWHKPARHECAGRRKRHDRTRSSLVQARNRLGERVETVAQYEIEPLPLWSQQHKSRLPSKEPETDPVLKQPNLVADRRRRNRQLGSRALEAQMPRCGLKGA